MLDRCEHVPHKIGFNVDGENWILMDSVKVLKKTIITHHSTTVTDIPLYLSSKEAVFMYSLML